MSPDSRSIVVGSISIGEVLSLLRKEFPDVTISKIRFLETEGLITPERTASGYRKFTEHDIEQLRTVLTLQRDQYLPLKVIREQLENPAAPAPVAGSGMNADDFRPGAGKVRLTREELAEAAGLPETTVIALENAGLVLATATGHYDEDALAICQVMSQLADFGVEPRHLKSFRVVTDREAGQIEQIMTPYSQRQDGRQQEVARELAALFVQLHAALLRAELVRSGKA